MAAQIVDPRKRGVGPTDDILTVVVVKISVLHRVRRAWRQPKWFRIFRSIYHFAQVIVRFQRLRLACRFKVVRLLVELKTDLSSERGKLTKHPTLVCKTSRC